MRSSTMIKFSNIIKFAETLLLKSVIVNESIAKIHNEVFNFLFVFGCCDLTRKTLNKKKLFCANIEFGK